MKKSLISLIALSSIASFSAQADFLIGGDLEANAWMPSVSVDDSEIVSDGSAYTFQGTLEHGVPVIPNFLVSYSTMSEDSFDYSFAKGVAYYEFLDNDIISFDLGLGASALNFNKIKTSQGSVEDLSGYMPTAYAALEFGIPSTPLFIYSKAFLSGTLDNKVIDGTIGVQYEFSLGVADLELQGGYQVQDYELGDFDGEEFDVKLDGFFLGLNLDF